MVEIVKWCQWSIADDVKIVLMRVISVAAITALLHSVLRRGQELIILSLVSLLCVPGLIKLDKPPRRERTWPQHAPSDW